MAAFNFLSCSAAVQWHLCLQVKIKTRSIASLIEDSEGNPALSNRSSSSTTLISLLLIYSNCSWSQWKNASNWRCVNCWKLITFLLFYSYAGLILYYPGRRPTQPSKLHLSYLLSPRRNVTLKTLCKCCSLWIQSICYDFHLLVARDSCLLLLVFVLLIKTQSGWLVTRTRTVNMCSLSRSLSSLLLGMCVWHGYWTISAGWSYATRLRLLESCVRSPVQLSPVGCCCWCYGCCSFTSANIVALQN